MRQLNAVILTSLVATCLLGSCNKPAEEGEVAPPPASASSTDVDITVQVPPGEAPAPAPASATGSADSGTRSMPVEPVDLSGKWIALFGRTAGGSTIDDAWKSGEVLEFKNTSGVVWTQKAGAAPADYSFTVNGNELTLTPGAVQNVGRDDEVGLLNVGRDDEVGLNKEQAGQQKGTTGVGTLKKTLFRDGNFLAVMGTDHDIMVYGKADGVDTAQPEVLGNYTATIAGSSTIPAKLEWQDNYLKATFEEGQGTFKGMWANGYFVGVTNGIAGNGLAALTREPDGRLNGIFLPMPFTKMNANFDFVPGQ